MPNKPLDRLLFAQGGKCFFCQQHVAPGDASVEHLVAKANGGGNAEENCVACCKALNALLGRMNLKDKLRVVLNQKGIFKCPGTDAVGLPALSQRPAKPTRPSKRERLAHVKANLQKRGKARPATVRNLAGTINALFDKKLSELEITSLIDALKAQRVIAVSGTRVTYGFPAGGV